MTKELLVLHRLEWAVLGILFYLSWPMGVVYIVLAYISVNYGGEAKKP